MTTMSCPGRYEHRILVALSESGAITAGQVARDLGANNVRSEAQLLRRDLLALMAKGWVTTADDLKPATWLRTPAGTDAMNVGA